MLATPGAGHFDTTDEKNDYIALYLAKAAQYRLPANPPLDGPVKLNPIDPTKQGWLAERWHRDLPPKAAPAPVGEYKGDPKEAFWFFDGELAKATEVFEAKDRGKKADLLGYEQNGKVVEQNPKTHQQVTLAFLPEGDGLTFKLKGVFIDTVPPGRPEGWTGLPAGSHVDHATGGGPVTISRICGPVAQIGPDTWAIRFYRMGHGQSQTLERNLARGDAPRRRAIPPRRPAEHDALPAEEYDWRGPNDRFPAASRRPRGHGVNPASRDLERGRACAFLHQGRPGRACWRQHAQIYADPASSEIPRRGNRRRVAVGPQHRSEAQDGRARRADVSHREIARVPASGGGSGSVSPAVPRAIGGCCFSVLTFRSL
jgi:hypothetical protein